MKNKPSEQSKKWIIDALFILMERKSFEKISVTEIAEKAGVSRLTFYRNFESKEQVLQMNFDLLFEQYLGFIDDKKCDLREALIYCFEFWEAHARESNLLVKNDLIPLLYQPFDRYLEKLIEKLGLLDNYTYIQKKFFLGGLFSAMLEWTRNPDGQKPECIADLLLDICKVNNTL